MAWGWRWRCQRIHGCEDPELKRFLGGAPDLPIRREVGFAFLNKGLTAFFCFIGIDE